jgi:hypothetical protein
MVKLMKEHGIAVCRELLPPSKRADGGTDDLDVIEECVGLRPTRRGGVRVETSWLGVLNELLNSHFLNIRRREEDSGGA